MAAVSMMSWLVAPRCTAAAAPSAVPGSSAVSALTRAGTGLPVVAACTPRDWLSKFSDLAAAVTAAPDPAGASPARSAALASAASVSSMACSQASSPVWAPPRSNSPPNKPLSLKLLTDP